MSKIHWILLGLIVILAFFLRFYRVLEVPPSLNWDEISIAYNAYSIMETGKDKWGRDFPIHFKAYGEYKLPTQIYFSIPAIYIFGLNDFSVRVTPIIYGTLTVLLLYFLTQSLFKRYSISLLASLFLAISPWHIQLTRASFESSFSVFWVIMGVWFLIKGFNSKKYWWVLSMIPFAVSAYTYNSARVFTPIFLLIILIIYRQIFIKFWKTIFISGLVFVFLLAPLVPFTFSPERNARYKLVSVTDDPGLIPRIEERRNLSTLPHPLPSLVHNRVTYISFYVIKNYLSHFSPDFLFIKGAPHKQHHPQGVGEMYLFQLPLVLMGIYYLIWKLKKWRGVIFSWILLAFIPVSITNDSIPHALRTVIANPPYQILSALGFYQIWSTLKNKNLRWGFVVISIMVVALSIGLYLQSYYQNYSKNYSRDWQYGYKEAVDYLNENRDKYDLVVFTRHYGEPHMFTLFYTKFDPLKYQTDPNLNRFETFDWVRVLNFSKYYFPDLGDTGTKFEDIIKNYPDKKLLFIGKAGDFPEGSEKLKVIKFLNGEMAFEIVEHLP